MYTLVLTADERRAIDWIGDRYRHGDELFKLLWGGCRHRPEVLDWDSRETISFEIPEYIAWIIGQMGEECNYLWNCFADELSSKLTEFCLNII